MKAKRIISVILALLMLISACLVTVSAEETLYKDVKSKRWSYKDIMYVSEKGLMNGKSEGVFAPAETMTRAMVVTVFYRLAGSPAVEYAPTFTDVKANKWFTDAVIWASNNGIVNGTGDAKYEPMANVTREQLATIIMRYAQFAYIKTEKAVDITGYADYKRIHDYAREAMAWANAEGLITGKTEDTLAPREGATREQFAAILHRFDTAEFDYELVYNTPVYGQNYTAPTYELVTDADIYVAVDGDDNNPGTLDKPVKTFEKARDMATELKKTKKSGGIKVAFKAGEYGALDNVLIDLKDSGTAECPITYCAYGDGRVIFSNGVDIPEADFEVITDEEAKMFSEEAASHIYKVNLNGKIDKLGMDTVLFGGNGPCIEARWPNSDAKMPEYKDCTSRVEEEGKAESEYDKLLIQFFLVNQVKGFSTYEGLKITGHLRSGWFQDTFPVKSFDPETNILSLDFENYDFDSVYSLEDYPLAYEDRMDDTVYFQNLAEFLDNNGEYWFDVKTKTLYVYEPKGDYNIPVGDTFITLGYGTSYVNFVGLEFSGTNDDAITSWGANEFITFDGCKIGNVAGSAVIYFTNVTDLTVKNCEIYNFVCGGLNITSYYWDDERFFDLQPANILVENNYFHDFGLPQYFDGADGVSVANSVGVKIAHNEFVNAVHGGVRYDRCIDLVIEYNVFDNMMRSTQDFGSVYTFRQEHCHGNEIRYNLFLNMVQDDMRHSIYFDGASGQKVYGNLFYNTGDIFFNTGRDHAAKDNIYIAADTERNFILGIDRIYNYSEEELKDPDNWVHEFDHNLSALGSLPEEGETGYEKWSTRWSYLYSYSYEPADLGKYDCIFTTINELKGNDVFNAELYNGSYRGANLDMDGNALYTLEDNPYFADPTHGDYTIVGETDFTYKFDFNAVGRK